MVRVRSPVLLFIPVLLAAQSGTPCLEYEPAVVHVTGRLVRRVFAGPPNYESIQSGDARDAQWLVALSTPACVNGSPNSQLNTAGESRIKEIQLVIMNATDWNRYAPLLGKNVRVTGRLFHAYTAHHRTPVLLTVQTIDGIGRGETITPLDGVIFVVAIAVMYLAWIWRKWIAFAALTVAWFWGLSVRPLVTLGMSAVGVIIILLYIIALRLTEISRRPR